MTKIFRAVLMAGTLAALPLLGACKKEATGQVAAVVGGEEITLQEINAQIAASRMPANAPKEQLQQAALQQIIDRRLLAAAAREDGLDRDPEYLLRQRQMEDSLLVQMLGQRATRAVRDPEQAKIDAYIAANPKKFAERSMLMLDQVNFPLPPNPDRLKALENAHSMGEVKAVLDQLNVRYQAGEGQIDTATLPSQILAQIEKLPSGEPFVLPNGGAVLVGVVKGRRAVPTSAVDARPMAVEAMRQETLMQAMESRLKAARTKTEIKYQDGFAPPKGAMPNGAAAKPAATPAPAAAPAS